ncbi:CatB-related O-acetyltransferase [Faecalibacter sp. LW9]|uniref:CatB-related O-acetyltransferase n=1 Tax=Faecalibacter sp. LW9 TaxID=3103144 RepID=UPI002AFEF65A|nr:CatB-related O-acetyltransferase [Faecalibacter sp. LW9]
MYRIRKILWRILGIDYNYILNKLDFTLLKFDQFTHKDVGTYDNGAKVWRWTQAKLEIGKYCSIAHQVNFIVDEGYHKGSQITSYPFINDKNKTDFNLELKQREGIKIGNDVWIGMGSYIMPGVTIGNGVTIAANSVVTTDIPDYVVIAGSPARIIKHKYTEEQKIELNKISWWNWDKETLNKRKLDFYQLTIDEFIHKYK